MIELILFLCICFSVPIICGIIGGLIISRQTKKQYKEYAKALHKLVNETCAELEESEQELMLSINKQKMKNTITDWHGRCTEIKDGETYTVVYCTIGLPYDLIVLDGLYHNADDDKFIGKPDNFGHIQKIYFDNNVPDEGDDIKLIRRVYTDDEFLNRLDKRFYTVEEFKKKLNELVN